MSVALVYVTLIFRVWLSYLFDLFDLTASKRHPKVHFCFSPLFIQWSPLVKEWHHVRAIFFRLFSWFFFLILSHLIENEQMKSIACFISKKNFCHNRFLKISRMHSLCIRECVWHLNKIKNCLGVKFAFLYFGQINFRQCGAIWPAVGKNHFFSPVLLRIWKKLRH